MTGSCSRPALLVVLAVAALLLAGMPTAAAHQGDPRIVTALDVVEPALPDAVVVQVQASLAAQLVVDNPTSTPLEVLGLDGRPFLRLSAAGVQADVASPDFQATSSPNGGAPPSTTTSPAPEWVRLSAGTSWGWFDHRLHPQEIVAPDDDQRPARLAEWTVPLRYGEQRVEVRGTVRFQPLLGAFVVSADPAPAGLVVQALPGRLPGVFLSNPEGRPLTVLGRDGEPFLRFGRQGVQVNVASRTHVEDRQARGLPAGPPSPEPRFETVDPAGTSYTWLDSRLRYPDELPPDDVLRAAEPAVVATWELPVEGVPALTGEVRWVPEAAAVGARGESPGESGPSTTAAALAGAGLLGLAAAVLLLRRRRADRSG